jgi:hypothetical protein
VEAIARFLGVAAGPGRIEQLAADIGTLPPSRRDSAREAEELGMDDLAAVERLGFAV